MDRNGDGGGGQGRRRPARRPAAWHLRIAAETNEAVTRYATGRALPLLRDGFRLKDDGGPICVLDVLTPRGEIGRGVTREELMERGLPAPISELRAHGS